MPHNGSRAAVMIVEKTRPIFQPMSLPICSALRPAGRAAAHRWVSTVPRKMAGDCATASPSCQSCTAPQDIVGALADTAVALYRAVMAMPAAGRSHSSQTCLRCAARSPIPLPDEQRFRCRRTARRCTQRQKRPPNSARSETDRFLIMQEPFFIFHMFLPAPLLFSI